MAFRLMSIFGRREERETIQLIKFLMKKIVEINDEFVNVSLAFKEKDYKKLAMLSKSVGKLEHEADGIRREICARLCQGAFLPMMRENLYKVVHTLDDVADEFEDAALFLVYTSRGKTPKEIRTYIIDMIEITLESVKKLAKIIEGVFENEPTEDIIQEVLKLEHDVDKIRNKAYDVLFLEKRLKEPHVQQVTRLAIAAVANITNKVEDACDEIQTLRMSKSA